MSHPQWSEGWGLHSNACLSQSQSSVFSFSQPSLCSHRTMVKCLLLCQKCVCLSHFLNACFFHFLSMFPNPSFQRCYSNLIEMLWFFLVSQSRKLKISTELVGRVTSGKMHWCMGLTEKEETHVLSWCPLTGSQFWKNGLVSPGHSQKWVPYGSLGLLVICDLWVTM